MSVNTKEKKQTETSAAQIIQEGFSSEELSDEKNVEIDMDSITCESADGIEADLAVAKKEAAALKDQFMRVAAEFDNYKKRAAREYDDFKKYANVSLVKALLPAVDNLERAVSAAESEAAGASSLIIDGVKMTLGEIFKVFENFQLRPVDAEGKSFDPAFHQAIAQEESAAVPENHVMKVFQTGYIMHDRLIRPAMVVVSKAPLKSV